MWKWKWKFLIEICHWIWFVELFWVVLTLLIVVVRVPKKDGYLIGWCKCMVFFWTFWINLVKLLTEFVIAHWKFLYFQTFMYFLRVCIMFSYILKWLIWSHLIHTHMAHLNPSQLWKFVLSDFLTILDVLACETFDFVFCFGFLLLCMTMIDAL